MPFFSDKPLKDTETDKGRFKRAWGESHGNSLLGFAAVIFVAGSLMIWLSPPTPPEPELDLTRRDASAVESELRPDALVIRVVTDQIESEGPIRIAVYDAKESFGNPDKAVIKDSLNPVDGFVVWEIKLSYLPETFAISAYHDMDDNGELNLALFNAPVEPYGFSNIARSLIGPPTFEQTLMRRPTEPTAIEIRVY